MAVVYNKQANLAAARQISLTIFRNPVGTALTGYRTELDGATICSKLNPGTDPSLIQIATPDDKIIQAKWQESYGTDVDDCKVWTKISPDANGFVPIIIYDTPPSEEEDNEDDEHKKNVTFITWETVTIASGVQVAVWGGLAENTLSTYMSRHVTVDSNGIWHICFTKKNGTNDSVYHGYSSTYGASWTTERIDNSWSGEQAEVNCVIDKNNTVHFVWREYSSTDGSHRCIKYRNKTSGGSWSAIVQVSDNSSPAGAYQYEPCIQIKPDGSTIGVTWSAQGWGTTPANPDIAYKERTGAGVWGSQELVTTDSPDLTGYRLPTLDYDDSGYPHVIFESYTAMNIYYNHKTAGGWQSKELVSHNGGDAGASHNPSNIVIDMDGDVHVAYLTVNGVYYDQYYRKRSSGSWGSHELMKARAWGGFQLQIDNEGTIMGTILYRDNNPAPDTAHIELISKESGGSWSTTWEIDKNTNISAASTQLLWSKWPETGGQYQSLSQQYVVAIYAKTLTTDPTSADIILKAHPDAVYGAINGTITSTTYRTKRRGAICHSKINGPKVSPAKI